MKGSPHFGPKKKLSMGPVGDRMSKMKMEGKFKKKKA